jgi:Holliday junction resolvase RusA-like endonuclease
MQEVSLFFAGDVVPKQSARVTAIPYWDKVKDKCAAMVKMYQTKKVKDYELFIGKESRYQLGDDFQPMTGPLKLNVIIVWPVPKSMTKKDQQCIADGGIIFKWTLPDLTDNLIKGICDGMEKIAYLNDGQICMISSQKYYGFTPGAHIKLKQIPDRYNPNSII